MKRRLRSPLLAAAAAAVFAAASVGGQSHDRPRQEPPPSATFDELVQVKVKEVQVFVRDKKTGAPVTGLTEADFEILEEKRPMKITNFYEYAGGRRVGEPVRTAAEPSPSDVIASEPGLVRRSIDEVPADERLHLVIYVDHFNVRPFNRNRVFRYVREFLRTNVDRADRVMLVSYTRSLKVERAFTSDPGVISRGLTSLEEHTGNRTQYDSERRDLLRDIEEARDPGLVMGRVRMFAEATFNDLQFTLDSLKQMVVDLAGVPGRKAMLYISDGLPMRAAEEMFHVADEKMRYGMGDSGNSSISVNLLDTLQYDASRRFTDLARTANSNGVTFYAIDASGLSVSTVRGAEVGYTEVSTNIDSIDSHNMQSTLLLMADETGGQAVVNTNNFERGLTRIAQDFDHFYSLGYAPGHSGNGRAYDVEVKVKNKKYEVRYPQDYRDKPIETEMADSTLASLRFGLEANEMGVEVAVRDIIRRDDGNFAVSVDLRIPIGEVTLVPTPTGYEGRLRVWVQAADEKGGISDAVQQSIVIPVKKEDYERAQKMHFIYQMPLLVRGGDQRMSIGLRDDVGGRRSVFSRSLRVG